MNIKTIVAASEKLLSPILLPASTRVPDGQSGARAEDHCCELVVDVELALDIELVFGC